MKGRKLIILPILLSLFLVQHSIIGQKKELNEEISLKAKTAVYQKEWSEAIKNLEKLISEFPRSKYIDNALYRLGSSLYRKSEGEAEKDKEVAMKKEAISKLNQLINQFSSSPWRNEAQLLRVEMAQKLAQLGYAEFKKYIEGTIIGGPTPPYLTINEKETDPEFEIKFIALNALVSVEKERAWPFLEKVAKENPSPRLRSQALFVLSQDDDPKIIPFLLERALNDPDTRIRENAIFWLRQQKEEEAADILIRIFNQAKDLSLKEKVLFALAQNESPKPLDK